jgi:hypothetical protein
MTRRGGRAGIAPPAATSGAKNGQENLDFGATPVFLTVFAFRHARVGPKRVRKTRERAKPGFS